MDPFTSMKQKIDRIILDYHIPGLAIGMLHKDNVIFEYYYGRKKSTERSLVDHKTMFCMTSVTKVVTAMAVLKLVEQGRVALDEKVYNILPHFEGNDPRKRQITIRMLLSHTSGLSDLSEEEYEIMLNDSVSCHQGLEDYVKQLSQRDLIAEPGQRYSYSNIGYSILGNIIETVTSLPFETYLANEVLGPLGIKNSTFSYPDVPSEQLAWPHRFTITMEPCEFYPYHIGDAPASFLFSTLQDMLLLAQSVYLEPVPNRSGILTNESLREMYSEHAKIGYPPFYQSVGLGWNVGSYKDHLVTSRGGMGFGFSDFVLVFPSEQFAAVILLNEESEARDRLVDVVASELYDLIRT